MQDNTELIENFALYRKAGLLSEDEFCQVSEALLDKAEPPRWIARLENACVLAQQGKLDKENFSSLKNRILEQAEDASGGAKGADALLDAAGADADKIIRVCVVIACLIGLLPLRVADAPFLIITQFVMLKKLCDKYGRKPGPALLLIVFAAILGPIVFNIFIKFIPMAGSIIGALVAGSFTWIIGAKVKAMLAKGQEFTFRNFISAPLPRFWKQWG